MNAVNYRLLIIAAIAYAALVTSSVLLAAEFNSDSIVGKWKDPDAPAIVEITNKGGYYEGVVVESSENPAAVSTLVFKNLVYDGSDGVWKGTVYSIKRNKDFDAEISMETDSKFLLDVKAGLMSKKFEWTRVK